MTLLGRSYFVALGLCALVTACGTDGEQPSLAGNPANRLPEKNGELPKNPERAPSADVAQFALDAGAQTFSIKVTAETIFKTEPRAAKDLSPQQKCGLPQGLHLAVFERPVVRSEHWFVKIKGNPEGCAFSEGYVFEGHAVVPELSATQYRLPIPGALVTSNWCECRNIGTSPHIGLDLARSGVMRSYALANGYVQNVIFNGGCGWEVTFRDDSGAVWLYRHLNQPPVSRGQTLKLGDAIGVHSSYPTSACGSGAHLHLERLTAGGFGDKALGRSCQYGYSSCNFNPRTPFAVIDGKFVASVGEAAQALSPGAAVEDGALALRPATEEVSGCQNFQARPVPVASSIDELISKESAEKDPSDKDSVPPLVATAAVPARLSAQVSVYPADAQRVVLAWKAFALEGTADNRTNRCTKSWPAEPRSAAAAPCIVSYELLVESADGSGVASAGKVLRVAADQNVRNLPLEVAKETRFCVAKGISGRYALRARLDDGRELTTFGQMDLSPAAAVP